jgi:hypothetical protein
LPDADRVDSADDSRPVLARIPLLRAFVEPVMMWYFPVKILASVGIVAIKFEVSGECPSSRHGVPHRFPFVTRQKEDGLLAKLIGTRLMA